MSTVIENRTRDRIEQTMRTAWAQVLGTDAFGPDDSFFTLGGDSITAIRLVSVCRAGGVEMKVAQVFLHPVFRDLVGFLGGAESAEPAPAPDRPSTTLADLDPALVPAGVVDAYPLSAVQLGMLYHCELDGDSGLYHDLTSCEIRGRWDRAALEESLAALCDRHDILRTSFDLADFREPLQLVQARAVVPVEVEDLSALDRAGQEEALAGWWARETGVPFDLSRAPLLRVHIGLRSPESFQLSLSVHHILVDGWSYARLVTELLTEYARRTAKGPVLPALSGVRYRDFITQEQRAVASADSRDFWSGLLTGAAPLPLPAPDGAAHGEAETLTSRAIPADLTAGVRRVADELGVPVKSVHLAAYLHALSALSGSDDVVGGICGSSRPEQEGAELVLGVFINVLPVRLAVRGGTWAELVTAAFDAERAHLPHRAYPLARIQRDLGRAPFETMFNFTDLHAFDAIGALPGIEADGWRFADRTNFPVVLEVNRRPLQDEVFDLQVRVDPEATAATTGLRLTELFLNALARLTADHTAAY